MREIKGFSKIYINMSTNPYVARLSGYQNGLFCGVELIFE